MEIRDQSSSQGTKTDEFSEKLSKGGGIIFNPKILNWRFWTFISALFQLQCNCSKMRGGGQRPLEFQPYLSLNHAESISQCKYSANHYQNDFQLNSLRIQYKACCVVSRICCLALADLGLFCNLYPGKEYHSQAGSTNFVCKT